jgi:hypothetical protein
LVARPAGSRSGLCVTLDAGVVNHVGRVLDLDETYRWAFPQLGVEVAWIIGESTSVRR